MGLKTVASLGKEKYERVSRTKLLNNILPNVNNYITRSKLRVEAKKLGTGRVSLKDFTRKIGDRTTASKFIDAVIQHAKKELAAKVDKTKGLTAEQKDHHKKINIQKDESGLTRQEYETTFAGNTVSTKSIGAVGAQKEKGSMGRIGINPGPAGFAGGQPGKATPGINFKP